MPSPGDLPDPGIKPGSPALEADTLTSEPPGKPQHLGLSTEELMLLKCGVGENSESPLDCREIQPVHSEGDQPWDFLEGMMLKLKLQYFGHLMRSVDSLERL